MDWDGDDLQVCVIVVQSIPGPKLFPLTFSYNGDVQVQPCGCILVVFEVYFRCILGVF